MGNIAFLWGIPALRLPIAYYLLTSVTDADSRTLQVVFEEQSERGFQGADGGITGQSIKYHLHLSCVLVCKYYSWIIVRKFYKIMLIKS